MSKPAVILLSGGLDSATTLAIAKAQGFTPYALSFRYGQRHSVELESARKVANAMGVAEHKFADIDLRLFGGSALTDDIAVPKNRSESEMKADIPVTYVPARNTIFLSFAVAWAEILKSYNIFIGVNAIDYSGYPDCRPEFIESYEKMANKATAYATNSGQHITIHTPLIHLTKADIIAKGLELGVPYGLTTSCYDPAADGSACGECDSCQLRLQGFARHGMADPVKYVRKP